MVDFAHWVLLSSHSDKMDVLFFQATPSRRSSSDSFQLGVWILALFGEPWAVWEFKYDVCGSESTKLKPTPWPWKN